MWKYYKCIETCYKSIQEFESGMLWNARKHLQQHSGINVLSNFCINHARGSPITNISKKYFNTFGITTHKCGVEQKKECHTTQ